MPDSAPLTLDSVSLLLVWTAIAIYVLAFIAYAIDLAQRSESAASDGDIAEPHELAMAGGVKSAGQNASVLTAARGQAGTGRGQGQNNRDPLRIAPGKRARMLWARIGVTLTVLGFLFHLAGTVLRGIAAERVPWANMYEFALTGTVLIVAVYLAVLTRYDLRFLGSMITGLVTLLLGGATSAFHVEVVPLADALQSVWLVIHVFVASLATALFALSFGLSVVQLMQHRRERKSAAPADDSAPVKAGPGFLRTLPSSEALESLAYRFSIIGFMFWTFTLVAGAIWANEAWSRYWGFDTKEVWTFVIWVLYAGYIHARATRGWRGNRSAWLCIIGFTTIIFNFTIVNQYFKGLHAYSGLS